MQLSENMLDMADAEFFTGSLSLINAGYSESIEDGHLELIIGKYHTAAEWFASLDEAGKQKVISYLQHRHGCYTKFSY